MLKRIFFFLQWVPETSPDFRRDIWHKSCKDSPASASWVKQPRCEAQVTPAWLCFFVLFWNKGGTYRTQKNCMQKQEKVKVCLKFTGKITGCGVKGLWIHSRLNFTILASGAFVHCQQWFTEGWSSTKPWAWALEKGSVPLSLTSWVILNKLFHIPKPQFSNL